MKTVLIAVRGSSMNCLLSDGDFVLANKGASIKTGDVIVYEYNGGYIIHRALLVGKRYIWEIGDNNYRIKKVKKQYVVAKAIANVSKNVNLNYPKLNRKILKLDLLRYVLGKNITSTKSLINNKFKCKMILAITKRRNALQLQYQSCAEE